MLGSEVPAPETQGSRDAQLGTGQVTATTIVSAENLAAELRWLVRAAEQRSGRKVNRTSLAQAVHVSPQSLYAYLSGSRLPPAATLDALLIELGASGDQLRRLAGTRDQVEDGRRRTRSRPDIQAPRGLPADIPGFVGGADRAVPHQLPAAAGHFVGRAAELAALRGLAGGAGGAAGMVVISAIGGMAGIGKTALALRFAHQVASEFPDGELYVNLRGFDPSVPPVTPEAAVRGFLDGLDVPPARIPVGVDAQAALYRSLLAGRRMLVVLDNAKNTGQVQPLLPGTPGCLVLVTSRHQLTSLAVTHGAHLIDLDVLTPAEAAELLAARLGAGRVPAEPRAAAEIITRCAGLPLALAIVAARAAAHPGLPLAALAAELRGSQLDALAGGDDPGTDIRAVFSVSYRALSPAAARLFRLLGLHPGPDISVSATASLAALPAPETRSLLAKLSQAHLISEIRPGRYASHDLVRAYAASLARQIDPGEQRQAATLRVFDHYLHTAHASDLILDPFQNRITPAPPRPGVTPQIPVDRTSALAWFTAEQAVLLAAIDQADPALDAHTWQLASTLFTFLHGRGLWREQAASQHAALAAAIRLGDQLAQARCHNGLASAYDQQGRLDDAETHLRQALDLCTQAGHQAGQASAHHNLAIVCGRDGRHREALHHAQRALALRRASVNKGQYAADLNQVGCCHARLGNHRRALISLREALTLHQEVDDPEMHADTWHSLGLVYHQLGQHGRAAACYQRALAMYRDLGYRYYEADTLTSLGETCHAAGQVAAARDAWEQALVILDDLGQPQAGQIRRKLASLSRAAARSPGQARRP
jgi:tetratricopeptide (TPR) repeat protein/transcriptional regulator with XRE-family HTH domain